MIPTLQSTTDLHQRMTQPNHTHPSTSAENLIPIYKPLKLGKRSPKHTKPINPYQCFGCHKYELSGKRKKKQNAKLAHTDNKPHQHTDNKLLQHIPHTEAEPQTDRHRLNYKSAPAGIARARRMLYRSRRKTLATPEGPK